MSSSMQVGELPCSERAGLLRRVRSWWSADKLEKQFWIFFAAAFFFDFGFDLYFFLFNLFLLNMHYDERTMGMLSSALTLGNVAGTIPVSILARRFGLKKVLLFCFVAAPLVSIGRTMAFWIPAQVGLAFLMGVALSVWPVCFAPAVAKLTSASNRVFAFSITFATGIGTGTLAGAVGGYLPQLLGSRAHTDLIHGMRFVLIGASLIAMLGSLSVARLQFGEAQPPGRARLLSFHPYLFRFLPSFAVWSFVTGSFVPFAPVFFAKQLGVSLQHVGMIFSGSELAQFCAVLLAPLIYRRTGTIAGIVVAELCTAAAAFALGHTHAVPFAVGCYFSYTAIQFTAGPGFYGTLMSQVPEAERSSASAMQNIVGALSQAAASALTGIMAVRYGYELVFHTNAVVAVVAALLVFLLLSRKHKVLATARNAT